MASNGDPAGALEFVAASALNRAAHYNSRATHLREMATEEPIGRLREQLLETARQYENLAATIMARLSS